MIRLGEDPVGFPAKYQARSMANSRPPEVASAIGSWLSRSPTFGGLVTAALVRDLRNASSFVAGRVAAERIEAMGTLSIPMLEDIESAYLSNNQLYPSHIGAKVIERILKAHGRQLPKRSNED